MDTIPLGKIKCVITSKLRKDTPEERVRQDVARSLLEEYGYAKNDVDIEFPIKMGSTKKRVDIAIFEENTEHSQKNLSIIIEVKKETIKPSDKTEGIKQLESYVSACINAKFALWVGNERIAFKSIIKNGRRYLNDIPDIPKAGETSIPKPTRASLVPAVNLKQVFKRIHNYIYVNQGFQKDKAFEELLKLIFIKVYDEQYDATIQFYMLPGEDIKNVRDRLASILKSVQKKYKYIFKGNEIIELNDIVLRYIVSEFQRFSLVETETDVKGEAYEEIIGPNLRGDRGEFFTPRDVCNTVVEMLLSLIPKNKITSPGELKILDPAVGTGGFLIAGIQKIKQIFIKRGVKFDELRDLVKEVAVANFYGIDFNPFLVKVAQMNMVMHGDGSSNMLHANSLVNPEEWDEYEAKENIKLGDFDIVVTNPPFSTKAKIDDVNILKQYTITNFRTENPRTSLPPEQLFIERCLAFLKPGGYLGIVLPNSILSNPGLMWIREWLLNKAEVIASVDLPQETFEPSTGTQTNILILQKKINENDKSNNEIFMATPEKVGHDKRGNPIYKSTVDGKIELDSKGNPILDDQLPLVSEIFGNWVKNIK